MLRKNSKFKDKFVIRLGNYYHLHTGYHGIFLKNLDDNVVFKAAKPQIVCCLLSGGSKNFHPIKHPFYSEIHKYPDNSKFIQSAFFPVYNQIPWVVDMDDICLPLFGSACINNKLMRDLYKDYFLNPLYRKTFLARIGLYSSPYCKAVLFHEMDGIKQAIYWFKYFKIFGAPEVKSFLSKISLAYPVAKPLVKRAKLQNPRTILFMARDFENKGGHIALATFRKLYNHDRNLALIYCGPIPDANKRQHADLLKNILYLPKANHEQALSLLKNSDILLLPTQHEALGITFIEAKAAGCVPVTYYGKGLEAMREIIIDRKNGILLKKPEGTLDIDKEARRFFRNIIRLVHDDVLLKRMKTRALREVQYGNFSFANRIKLLKKIFFSKTQRRGWQPNLNGNKLRIYKAYDFHKLCEGFRKSHKVPRALLVGS